jgi:hypothetical protein
MQMIMQKAVTMLQTGQKGSTMQMITQKAATMLQTGWKSMMMWTVM